jgi:UDP:flavonoid glycosyltransferase YjiC (YdhE family)
MKKILVAPLNWGLGHATRCIPIIKGLIENGFEPIIASDGVALELLKKEFPALVYFELPSYNIQYAEWKKF